MENPTDGMSHTNRLVRDGHNFRTFSFQFQDVDLGLNLMITYHALVRKVDQFIHTGLAGDVKALLHHWNRGQLWSDDFIFWQEHSQNILLLLVNCLRHEGQMGSSVSSAFRGFSGSSLGAAGLGCLCHCRSTVDG
jgi:hypothetical protein